MILVILVEVPQTTLRICLSPLFFPAGCKFSPAALSPTVSVGFYLSFQLLWGSPSGSEVKPLPAVWKTRVWSLGQEDPLEKEMATRSSTLAWKILWARIHGVAKSRIQLSNFTFTFSITLLLPSLWWWILCVNLVTLQNQIFGQTWIQMLL